MAAKTASHGGVSLGEYVTGLREGSLCFCCGRGIMRSAAAVATRTVDGRPEPLTCSLCGSEVVDEAGSTDAEPSKEGPGLTLWARQTAA